MSEDGPEELDFEQRRAAARARLNALVGADGDLPDARRTWFEQVYDLAGGDPAAIPWADLAPKPALVEWLAGNPGQNGPGQGRRAVDIACGLGDNAEALSAAGYRTTAFDLAPGAVQWARRRFPSSSVDYRVGDLFDLPAEWHGAFDLVHEYYTIQALSGALRAAAFGAIAGLAAPGAALFVVCRSRDDGEACDGPPWPVSPGELAAFEGFGLDIQSRRSFVTEKSGRVIPHLETVYRKRP